MQGIVEMIEIHVRRRKWQNTDILVEMNHLGFVKVHRSPVVQ